MSRTCYIFPLGDPPSHLTSPVAYETPVPAETAPDVAMTIPLNTKAGRKLLDVVSSIALRTTSWLVQWTIAGSGSNVFKLGADTVFTNNYSFSASYNAILDSQLVTGSEINLARTASFTNTGPFSNAEVTIGAVSGSGTDSTDPDDPTSGTYSALISSSIVSARTGTGVSPQAIINGLRKSNGRITGGTFNITTRAMTGCGELASSGEWVSDDPDFLGFPMLTDGTDGRAASYGTFSQVGLCTIRVPDWRYREGNCLLTIPIYAWVGGFSEPFDAYTVTGSSAKTITMLVTPVETLPRGLNRARPREFTTRDPVWRNDGSARLNPLTAPLL